MIKKRDLPQTTTGEFLYCSLCQGEWSATAGDYFMLSPDENLYCLGQPGSRHRKHALQLVRRECRIVPA